MKHVSALALLLTVVLGPVPLAAASHMHPGAGVFPRPVDPWSRWGHSGVFAPGFRHPHGFEHGFGPSVIVVVPPKVVAPGKVFVDPGARRFHLHDGFAAPGVVFVPDHWAWDGFRWVWVPGHWSHR
jgi:hypothetical protein